MKQGLVVALGVIIGASVTFGAQRNRTVEDQTRWSRALVLKSAEGIIADRHKKCMAAFGNPAFCDCLNNLPPLTTFETYIAVATSPTPDTQLTSRIVAIRDHCTALQMAR